ncbi:hypothetical protein JCM6882_008142 [Rhodosporidiobolus microsporus]
MSDEPPPTQAVTALESATMLAPCSAGWQLAMILYGVYLVTAGQYLRSPMYKRAMLPVKVVLWTVSVLLTAYTGLTYVQQIRWSITIDRTIQNYLVGASFETIPPVLAGLVAAPVQVLLTLRTATLIRSRLARYVFSGIVGSGILAALLFAILTCPSSLTNFANHTGSPVHLDFNTCLAIWLWLAAGVDVVISGALAFTLKKRVAGFNEKTDGLLHRLIVAALQTAAYTTILAVTGAILAVASFGQNFRFTYLSYPFWAPLPACYGLSLYTTLSTRRTVEEYIGGSTPLPLSVPPTGAAGRTDMRAVSPAPRLRPEERSAVSVREEEGGRRKWSEEMGPPWRREEADVEKGRP